MRPTSLLASLLFAAACGSDEPIDLDPSLAGDGPDVVSAASPEDLGPDLVAAASPAPDAAPAPAPADDPSRAAWEADIAPRFERCVPCHEADLLAPPDPLASLLAYRDGALLDCDAPARSPLVSKGAHDGAAAFSSADEAAIVAWIAARCAAPAEAGPPPARDAALDAGADAGPEPDAAPPEGASIVGPAFLAVQNENSWDLSDLAPGITGARLTFTATFVGGGLHLERLSLHAGPAGLRARGPSLEACRFGQVVLDAAADFPEQALTLEPGAQASMGTGTVTLPGIEAGMPLAVRFAALGPADGPFGPPDDRGGACGGD